MRPKTSDSATSRVHQLESPASRPKAAQRSVYRAKIILSRLAGVGVRATAKALNCKTGDRPQVVPAGRRQGP